MTLETATTGVGSRFFPLPARSSATSFYSVSQRLYKAYYAKGMPVLKKEDHAQTTYLYYERQILEQSKEWNSSLNAVLVDFWESIVSLFAKSYTTRAFHRNWFTSSSILSPVLFSLAIDRVMRNVTQGKRQEWQWTVTSILDTSSRRQSTSIPPPTK